MSALFTVLNWSSVGARPWKKSGTVGVGLASGVEEAVGVPVTVVVGVTVGGRTGVSVAGAAVWVGAVDAGVHAASPNRRNKKKSVFFMTVFIYEQ